MREQGKSYLGCSEEFLRNLRAPVKEVIRLGINTLAREYDDGELKSLWDEIHRNLKEYLRKCSHLLDERVDRIICDEFQLAELLIAYCFKVKGKEVPGITDRFRKEEYEVISNYEKLRKANRLRNKIIEEINRLQTFEERIINETTNIKEIATSITDSKLNEFLAKYENLRRNLCDRINKLSNLLKELEATREELLRMKKSGVVREIIDAEIKILSNLINKLQEKMREYKKLVKILEGKEKALRKKALIDIERGSIITIDEARSLIKAYFSKLYSRLTSRLIICNPRENKLVTITSWNVRKYPKDELGREGLLFIKEKGLIGGRNYIVVEVQILVHRDKLLSNGFDDQKVNLREVLAIVSDRVERVIHGEYYHILILASPTGFTKRAIDFISGGEYHRSFTLRDLTIYLVNLLTGRIYYNGFDEVSKINKYIAEPNE